MADILSLILKLYIFLFNDTIKIFYYQCWRTVLSKRFRKQELQKTALFFLVGGGGGSCSAPKVTRRKTSKTASVLN